MQFAEIELFFETYKNLAMAFYTFTAFTGIVIGIIFSLYRMHKSHVNQRCEEAKTEQRHEFQAGYFDLQERRYDEMLKRLIEIEKTLTTRDSTL